MIDVERPGSVADKDFQRALELVAPAFRISLSPDADQNKVLRQYRSACEMA
jgi:hypothetical protein